MTAALLIRIQSNDFLVLVGLRFGTLATCSHGVRSTVVLWYPLKNKKRFSELKRLIPNITEKMLSIQLKDLENDGLVERKVYPEVPPKVEYQLTNFGKTLIPMLEEIALWGRNLAETKGKLVAPGKRSR